MAVNEHEDEAKVVESGDPACWLNRVCPDCDAVLDGSPPAVCPRCGAEVLPQ
jgi:hypothetical protein